MVTRITAKKIAGAVLDGIGLLTRQLRTRGQRNSHVILMYHRILPRHAIHEWVQSGMVVTPESLDMHLSILKSEFDVVSLESIVDRVSSAGSLFASDRPMCAITFDDGWLDFYQYAFPLLRKHDVPATVFLPTDFVGTNRWFWTDLVGKLLAARAKDGRIREEILSLGFASDIAERLMNSSHLLFPALLEEVITALKPRSQTELDAIIDELAMRSCCDLSALERVFINWEEAREILASSRVSFGSHTSTHRILTGVSLADARIDTENSVRRLRRECGLGLSRVAFCYPNGNFDLEIASCVQPSGCYAAVTTQSGWVSFGDDVTRLPRIGIHEDVASTKSLFLGRLVGLW